MKKLFMLFLLFAVNSYAADFTPTPMTISVQPQLEYKFDGSSLEIPFTLTGKSGAIWLVINTHGQAENIVNVRNGFLGWHYVNKIDTTIYISDRFERQPGENTIVWNGRDENGNNAEPGSYDYYLWGYDDKSSRELVCNFVLTGCNQETETTKIYEKDEDGLPLSKPFLFGNQNAEREFSNNILHRRAGTHFKWNIGNNPEDLSLLQTTMCSMYHPMAYPVIPWGDKGILTGNPDWKCYGGAILNPSDYNIFYHTTLKNLPIETSLGTDNQTFFSLYKWNFVTGGEAVLDTDWFGFEKTAWKDHGLFLVPTCYTDNNYIYASNPSWINASGLDKELNKIQCVSFDGEIVFDKNFHEWFMPQDRKFFSQDNCSVDRIYSRMSNKWFLLGTNCCLHQLINTSRLIEDPDDETDMVIFGNSNGDYFMDNGWAANTDHQWFCIQGVYPKNNDNDYIKRLSIAIDSNNFNIIYLDNYGIVSFGVSTQDGTGVGYMSFADDIVPTEEWSNSGGQLCDSGSIYDGLYIGRPASSTSHYGGDASYKTYYVAFDSAHGMITNNPAVETQTPLQFKVSQNSPNPFNPSTTISFSIPEKSDVTIDIYNIAGQKIKSLINGPLSAGEHSVKWDAGGCSAGVYFHKVKAGKFEKTMRMTLVK